MNLKFVLATVSALCATAMLPAAAHADTLDTSARRHHRGDDAASGLPTRGMSMAQVERRFGAPEQKLPTAGGDTRRHPPINRWRYPGYTVYFERTRVIHSVIDPSSAAPNS